MRMYQRHIFSIVNSVKMFVILQIQHLIIILLWTIISILEINTVKGIQRTPVGGLILSNSASITTNYWLSEVYDEEVANAHRDGYIHIHDLNMLTGCNAGWSLKELIQQGFGWSG